MNKIIPKEWLKNHSEYLMNYALENIPERTQAQTMVDDTFRLALASQAEFSGNSAQRKWLTAILKNKIGDFLAKNPKK